MKLSLTRLGIISLFLLGCRTPPEREELQVFAAFTKEECAYRVLDENGNVVHPLHHAICVGDLRKVQRVLRKDLINQYDRMGSTPLTLAILKGDYVVVELVLAAGANPNLCDRDGLFPVVIAAYGFSSDSDIALGLSAPDEGFQRRTEIFDRILSLLLIQGANPNLNDGVFTALDAAIQRRRMNAQEILRRYSARSLHYAEETR